MTNKSPCPRTSWRWYFTDKNAATQGPFSGEQMAAWLESGYFPLDLPISYRTVDGPFVALNEMFPDTSKAFRTILPVNYFF